jgi:hypothetical protein
MRKILSLAILCVFLSGLLFTSGCKEPEPVIVYVCENGDEVSQKYLCRDAVKKKDAENYAKRYVSAYFVPYGGKAQLVSSYLDPEKKDYFATFVVSEKGGTPYETVVSVDGLTGQVNCTSKCEYT